MALCGFPGGVSRAINAASTHGVFDHVLDCRDFVMHCKRVALLAQERNGCYFEGGGVPVAQGPHCASTNAWMS